MKIIQSGVLSEADKKNITKLANDCGILFDTARLLYSRKIDDAKKAKAFLNPSAKGFLDPFGLTGMKAAAEEIENAKRTNKSVLIFGDYDADGICAATVLKKSLEEYGINAKTVVPEREDGYGLNLGIIEKIHKETPIDLIITVDCGISDAEKIESLKKSGITVIVTDHHEPPQNLPDCIVIDPKLPNETYGFAGLCGAGVAYKLAYALIGEKANSLLDFVALATVADSMDLIGENRDIVFEGLKIFNSELRPCFKFLFNSSGGKITSQNLAFTVAPRINAGGRMGDARSVLKLFSSESEKEIYDLGVKLNEYNIARQAECEKIYEEARKKIIEENLAGDSVILVADEGWKAGFVGIVASKLVEEFCRPVIVFAEQDGQYKGSARSYNGVNIYDAISAQKDILVTFGGHAQAAGVGVEKDKLKTLRTRLNAFVDGVYGKLNFEKTIAVDWKIEGDFSHRFAKEIEMLEPFGVGNKRPVFSVKTGAVSARPLKLGSPHVSFSAAGMEMLYFGGASEIETLGLSTDKEIVFESNVSVFRGKEYCKGYVKSVVADYGDFSSVKDMLFEKSLTELKNACEPPIAERVRALPENKKSFGTIFAVSEYSSLSKYPSLKNLPIFLSKPLHKNFQNCVVVAPRVAPEGYDTAIYLDEPLIYATGFEKSFLVEGLKGYSFVDKISVDRSDFVQVYVQLERLVGKPFKNLNALFDLIADRAEFCREQFVFSAAVFMELGIYYSRDGVLKRDSTAKSTLTNSAIYSKISDIKGLI